MAATPFSPLLHTMITCGGCREEVEEHLTSKWSRHVSYCHECRANYNRFSERHKMDRLTKVWFKRLTPEEREAWFKRHKQLNADRESSGMRKRKFESVTSSDLGVPSCGDASALELLSPVCCVLKTLGSQGNMKMIPRHGVELADSSPVRGCHG